MVHLSTEHNKNPGKLLKAKRRFYNLKSNIALDQLGNAICNVKVGAPGFTFRVKELVFLQCSHFMLMRTMVSLKNEDIVNKAIAKKICLRKRRILRHTCQLSLLIGGVSRIRNQSPGLPYRSSYLPDKIIC